MKARLILLLIAVIVAGIVIFRHERRQALAIPPIVTSTSTVEVSAGSAESVAVSTSTTARVSAGIVIPATPIDAGTLDVELDNVKLLIRDYRLALGENPVGSNAEITKALMGANAKKTRFVTTGDARLNDKGELVDPWRTPYFFHQLSARDMEVRSAGPDKQMWTSDDIVLR